MLGSCRASPAAGSGMRQQCSTEPCSRAAARGLISFYPGCRITVTSWITALAEEPSVRVCAWKLCPRAHTHALGHCVPMGFL